MGDPTQNTGGVPAPYIVDLVREMLAKRTLEGGRLVAAERLASVCPALQVHRPESLRHYLRRLKLTPVP